MRLLIQKRGSKYRFRLGLQMFRMKTNETYSLIVELYNRDYKTWQRQETFVNGTGMWVINHNTTKYQYHYGSSGDLYYSKTSSSAPIFVYWTVHFHDKGGDMSTYPKEFKNQVYIVAYGIEGLTDHVDPEVYDAHEAFEIDKTKMKMLVPLDMNGKQLMNANFNAFALKQDKMLMLLPLDMNGKKIMNTNFDLKFGDTFKVINCYVEFAPQRNFSVLTKKSDNQNLGFSIPVVIHSITLFNQQKFGNKPYISIIPKSSLIFRRIISLDNLPSQSSLNDTCTDLPMMCIFNTGINYFAFYNVGKSRFDVDIVITYM